MQINLVIICDFLKFHFTFEPFGCTLKRQKVFGSAESKAGFSLSVGFLPEKHR